MFWREQKWPYLSPLPLNGKIKVDKSKVTPGDVLLNTRSTCKAPPPLRSPCIDGGKLKERKKNKAKEVQVNKK